VTIFGVPWDDLSLEHLESFLASAGGEGLTWEAKGVELPHPGSVAKHLCGFANAVDGGYLLLGAERASDGSWTISGVEFPGGDPPVWVTNIARTLSPMPRVDVRDWKGKSGQVAVVRIDPVAEPPCMTSGGQVFERVSGQTVPVVDPGELGRLYGRGEVAVERARKDATEAARLSLAEHGSPFRFGLGLAAVEYESGIESRLFRSRSQGYLRKRFAERLRPNRHDWFHGARLDCSDAPLRCRRRNGCAAPRYG
jgi:Putative DNA-binding domain